MPVFLQKGIAKVVFFKTLGLISEKTARKYSHVGYSAVSSHYFSQGYVDFFSPKIGCITGISFR